jgi:hypothetical protein
MTSRTRDFHRQIRLVAHYLELLHHLQEMRFDDPRMVLQGLHDLIDQTVSPLLSQGSLP